MKVFKKLKKKEILCMRLILIIKKQKRQKLKMKFHMKNLKLKKKT